MDEEDDENPDNAIAQTDEELEDPVLANGMYLNCLHEISKRVGG